MNYHRILPYKEEKIAKKNGYYEANSGWKFSYEYYVDERKYRAYKNLYKWSVPKLFIHGTNDIYVNYKDSLRIAKRCKNSRLKLIDNAGHSFRDDNHLLIALEETLNFIM